MVGLIVTLFLLVPLWRVVGVLTWFSDAFAMSALLVFLRGALLLGPLIYLYEIVTGAAEPTFVEQPPPPLALSEQDIAETIAAAERHGVDPDVALAAVSNTLAPLPEPPRDNPAIVVAKTLFSLAAGVAIVIGILVLIGFLLLVWFLSQQDCFLGC